MKLDIPEQKIEFEVKLPLKRFTKTIYHTVLPAIGHNIKLQYYDDEQNHIERTFIVTRIIHEINCGYDCQTCSSNIVIEVE